MHKRTLLLASVLISLSWIGMIILFLNPSYQSQEEIAIQYRLTGADGLPASYLAHLNYGFHYWLSFIVFKGFELIPILNWYTVLLIVFHWIALSAIVFSCLASCGIKKGSFFILLYLVFIATPILQILNLTGTSIEVAIAGVCLLSFSKRISISDTKTLTSISLLVLAGMIRMHSLALIILASAPYFTCIKGFKNSKRTIAVLLISGVLSITLNQLHVYHNKTHIPNWENTEQFRQAFFKIANSPLDEQKMDKNSLQTLTALRAGIVWDTQFVSASKLTYLYEKAYNPRTISSRKDLQGLFWAIKNNLYLITLFVSTLLFSFLYIRMLAIRIAVASILNILILAVLWKWFKLTNEIILGIVGAFYTIFTVFITPYVSLKNSNRQIRIVLLGLYLFLGSWGIRIVYHRDKINIASINTWRNIQQEIVLNSNHIFVILDNLRNARTYSIWYLPNKMPLKNVMDRHRLFFSQHELVERLQYFMQSPSPRNNKYEFLFAGASLIKLSTLYPNIRLSDPLDKFKYMSLRYITN